MNQALALGRSEDFRGDERPKNSQEDLLDRGHGGERSKEDSQVSTGRMSRPGIPIMNGEEKIWGWGVLEEEIMKLL